MSVHKKLMQARVMLQSKQLKKSGHNKFAGYQYFELGDFLPTVQQIFNEIGLCGTVSFTSDTATLTVTDIDDGQAIEFTSPMGSASLKGCYEVQNIGAVETYQRRYLWVLAMEVVEHDVLDATTGSETKGKGQITPTSGLWDVLSDDEKSFLEEIASEVIALINSGDICAAVEHLNGKQLDTEEKAAIWTRFDSKQRAGMKKEFARVEALKSESLIKLSD